MGQEDEIAYAGPIREPAQKFWEEALDGFSSVPVKVLKDAQDYIGRDDKVGLETYLSDAETFPNVPDVESREKRYACMSMLLGILQSDEGALQILEKDIRDTGGINEKGDTATSRFLWPNSEGAVTDSGWLNSLQARFPQNAQCLPVLFKFLFDTRMASFDKRGQRPGIFSSISSTTDGGIMTMEAKVRNIVLALKNEEQKIHGNVALSDKDKRARLQTIARASLQRIQGVAGLKQELSEALLPTNGTWRVYKNKDGGWIVSTERLEKFFALLEKHKRGEMTWQEVAEEMGLGSRKEMKRIDRIAVGCPVAILPLFQHVGTAMIDRYLELHKHHRVRS